MWHSENPGRLRKWSYLNKFGCTETKYRLFMLCGREWCVCFGSERFTFGWAANGGVSASPLMDGMQSSRSSFQLNDCVFQEENSENLTEEQKEVLKIWNDLSKNEQETVMWMLCGLRKQENSSIIGIGCSFFIFKRERGEVFLVYSRALEYNKTSSFYIRFKTIIRKSANQMKVWDAKLQGL